MTNKEIARALNETASLIELTGGNAFRSRAYQNAGRTIERLEEHAVDLLAEGRLVDLPGIGAGLEAQIRELVETGTFGLREELQAQLPPGLGKLLRIKGLGVRKVRQLWQTLGVTSIDALEAAAATGRLAELSGFGAKTQARLLTQIEHFRRYDARRRYADALALAQPVLARLRAQDAVLRAEPSGALRRQLETVAAITIIAATTAPDDVAAALAEWTGGAAPEADADGLRYRGAFSDGFALEVLAVAPEAFGTAWWRDTGAVAHVDAFTRRHGPPAVHADEADLFAAAGLPVIPPELREGDGEVEAAAAGTLPALLTVDDLRGTLHNHTTYSDGAHTLREMADAARARGLSYFGVCDHSRSLAIASGLSIEDVQRQQDEIRALNAAYAAEGGAPFRILSGTESDVLPDGALDYPDDVLATFDFVVASIHSGFDMTERAATERLIRAVENPYTSILGHATGRLLLSREGYAIDHKAVIDACAASGVSIELNANPHRLDMDWRWLRYAADQGVLISINPDAHSTHQLDNVRWGVAVARKAWLTADQCLNALSLEAITAWMADRRVARQVS